MAVYFSLQVRAGAVQFWSSLSTYGISHSRAVEKYQEMREALLSLDSIVYRRVCPFKDLGQTLTRTGSPHFPFLYVYVYTDRKSKSKWSFSYVVDSTSGDVFVLQMKYSKFIKEEQEKHIIHLQEKDLKYIISESVNRIIQEYTDHSIFGWEHAKKKFKDGGATDEVIKKLKDAYDVYAQERASQGRIPNDTGFDLWRSEKDLKSCEQGKGMMFPNYLD